MPPESNLCAECQILADLKTGIEKAKAGEYPEALKLFKHVCSADGQDEERAKAHYYTGVIYAKQEKLGLAESEWWKCLDLEPGHTKAKKRLVELIVQKPKRQWEKRERILAEGSEFAKAMPQQRRSSSLSWIRWAIAACVLIVLGVGGFFGLQIAREYFTFGRHVENIENLVLTGQTARSLQYFNDNFQPGEGAARRKKAEKALAPVYKRVAKQRIDEGEIENARKLLRIAAGFDPEDEEVQQALKRLQPQSQETEPAEP